MVQYLTKVIQILCLGGILLEHVRRINLNLTDPILSVMLQVRAFFSLSNSFIGCRCVCEWDSPIFFITCSFGKNYDKNGRLNPAPFEILDAPLDLFTCVWTSCDVGHMILFEDHVLQVFEILSFYHFIITRLGLLPLNQPIFAWNQWQIVRTNYEKEKLAETVLSDIKWQVTACSLVKMWWLRQVPAGGSE